jgi:para-aminobenzoate synthetase component 1
MDHNLYSIFPRNQKKIKLSGPVVAHIYFSKDSLNLLTGERGAHSFSDWMNTLDHSFKQKINPKRVIHFFYEAGFVFEELKDFVTEETILAIDITYANEEVVEFEKCDFLKLTKKRGPIFAEYESLFQKGYAELKKGNCYQFNLTCDHEYSFDESVTPEHFMAKLWEDCVAVGAQASGTFCGPLNKLFLSNSPESLFEIKDNILVSKPVKGTLLKESDEDSSIQAQWKILSEDKKSQAELYMITDLIRNDLSRIDLPTAYVSKKKAMMIVPKLIHQYAEVCLQLRAHVTLKKIIESLFPGGSITGAPKKRVMAILYDLEKRTRGFYCGSTLTFFNETIEASINIRSCEIDFNESLLIYQSGGGITLLSDVKEEFKEQSYKLESFIQRLTP